MRTSNQMHDKLIGYLLEALEVDETTYVKERLEVDSEARRELDLLRTGMLPFEGDREQVDAPFGLAIRTCQRINQARDTRPG